MSAPSPPPGGAGKRKAAPAGSAPPAKRAFSNPKGVELSERQWARLNGKAERRRARVEAAKAARAAEVASALEAPPERTHPASELLGEGEEEPVLFELDGLQHVRPYRFVYTTHAKERWVGQPLAALMGREFLRYSEEYFSACARRGTLRVNGERSEPGRPLARGDRITHSAHRHEPPVLAGPVPVVAETPHVVAVSKPGTLPAHPCGGYRHNSLEHALGRQLGARLFLINRLDRLTTGLVVLGRTGRVAARLTEQLAEGTGCRKVYLARVLGEFPAAPAAVEVALPVEKVDWQTGEHRCAPAGSGRGKPARSRFRRLSFNGRTSVVECEPLTGRTHQLRLHLQSLGHPVANDPKYGGRLTEANSYAVRPLRALSAAERALVRPEEALGDPLCAECAAGSYWGEAEEGSRYCTHIWLHCLSYTAPGWAFEAPRPAWAAEDFDCGAELSREARVGDGGRLVA